MPIFLAALTFSHMRLDQDARSEFLPLFFFGIDVLLVLASSCLWILLATTPPDLALLLKLSSMVAAAPVEVILFAVVFATVDAQWLCCIIVLLRLNLSELGLDSISFCLELRNLLLKRCYFKCSLFLGVIDFVLLLFQLKFPIFEALNNSVFLFFISLDLGLNVFD